MYSLLFARCTYGLLSYGFFCFPAFFRYPLIGSTIIKARYLEKCEQALFKQSVKNLRIAFSCFFSFPSFFFHRTYFSKEEFFHRSRVSKRLKFPSRLEQITAKYTSRRTGDSVKILFRNRWSRGSREVRGFSLLRSLSLRK